MEKPNAKNVVFYPEKRLALTSGIQPGLNPHIKIMLSDIKLLANDDPLAKVMS